MREVIRLLLREESALKLSVTIVGRLPRRPGLSRQRTLLRATEQNLERVHRRHEQEVAAIRQQARESGAMILFIDKAGVRCDYPARLRE
jgi:hypothetical protein